MHGKLGGVIQIKMSLYEVPNSTGQIDAIVVETITEIPEITPLLLIFVFCVVAIGGAISQKRRMGYTDLPLWSTIGSIATLMIALPLSIGGGFIQLDVLAIVIVLTIFCGVWFFLGRNRREVY